MVTIVMAYYQRKAQLLNTLKSFLKYDPKEFNVVVVDDASPECLSLSGYPFEVKILRVSNKTWFNPAPAFNMGFSYALIKNPDIIIIQNAECYHEGDILSYAKGNLTDENYISFGCYSISQNSNLPPQVMNPKGISFNGEDAWYNHPVHRAVAYHFCSAITTKNLIKINGFDERFSYGIACEDNYFLYQIRLLGLKIEILAEPFVIHQWHPEVSHGNNASLWEKNTILLNQLMNENNYRAEHIFTLDLK